ncbi:MAG: mechanosensitive ion channel family protein [Candidatus Omnitrophica bacterium]|nr:mechanosensitive ion channel family protein [Candidatus Omnitrophota bacterium]
MQDLSFFNIEISPWILAPVIYFIWVSLLLILKKIAYARMQQLAGRTASELDDVFLNALDFPLLLLIFVSGAVIVEKVAPLALEQELTQGFVIAFKATTVVAIVLFLDRLLRNLIQAYSSKINILKTSGGVAQTFVRIIVLALGLLILLDSFGVSITPVLASLGIGSLAVALALQPTLENFFSGIQIVIDKSIKVGQFIKLDSGEEGYVQKIGWRSTWVRMLPNNIVVMPNKTLVNSKIVNYYYPDQEMAVLVQVGVHYESDLKHVEKVTMEVGEEIMKKVKGGVPEFKPFIRYHTFNDFSIDFTVILRCKEFVDNYLIKHEFIKRLHERYAKEGINIPYPIRAINYSQEKAQGPIKK